jgi:hypothetical protein
MNDPAMMLAYLAPMLGVLGLFWNVARKLGHLESEMKNVREENRRLRSDIVSLQTLLSMLVDSRRVNG